MTPASERHLLRRFSAGLTPTLLEQAAAAGGARAWFEQQLSPDLVPDPRGAEIDTWWAFLGRTTQEIFDRSQAGTEGVQNVMLDLVRWTIARRLESARQLQEVMVDFWSNHLNVPLPDGAQAFARADYDKVVRANALGTFEALLQSTITHPAMGIYLTNATSTKAAPNENLGRELLELHTVGVDGGYSETDVKNSARILTGYRVWVWPSFKVFYDPDQHYTGPVKVLGFTSPNAAPDGRTVTLSYLSYLARHQSTAEHLARKLCVRFVSDNPSDSIVNAVATAYLDNGTAIKPTLRALVDHPDFAGSSWAKLRTPQEDWQATVRALGITLKKPTNDYSFGAAMYFLCYNLGASPYRWPRPDGYPDANARWANDGRMLNSFSMHRQLAGHWVPAADATFLDLAKMFPALPATLQSIIDAVSVQITGEPASAALSRGIATALGWDLSRRVKGSEAAAYWTAITIVSSVLDSPLHLYR